jgi:hypothetical protein
MGFEAIQSNLKKQKIILKVDGIAICFSDKNWNIQQGFVIGVFELNETLAFINNILILFNAFFHKIRN